MTDKFELTNDVANFSILKLASERQIQAKIFHHDLAYKIFSWSNTLLLAILGFVLSQGKNLSTPARWFLTSAVVILSLILFIWQNRNRLAAIEHAQNVTRIEDLLHLKEPGYFGGEKPIVQKLYSIHPK